MLGGGGGGGGVKGAEKGWTDSLQRVHVKAVGHARCVAQKRRQGGLEKQAKVQHLVTGIQAEQRTAQQGRRASERLKVRISSRFSER